MTDREIIAYGCGGVDGENPWLDLYLLAQNKSSKKPKICFLPTASGDNHQLISYFKSIFEQYPCSPSSLSLFHPHTADIEDFILSHQMIFVGGGHTKSMLGVWKEWELDKILKKAYENGVILAGGSAGSVCWFEQCITDSIPGGLSVMDCLGFLSYSNCPHFGSQQRKSSYANFLKQNKIKMGYAATDSAAFHFKNEKLYRCISSYHNSYTYECYFDKVPIQKPLKTTWLGLPENREKLIFSSKLFKGLSTQSRGKIML